MKRLCLLLLPLPALLLGGCATHALWEADRFARYYEPANPSRLALFQDKSGDKVLVQYNEVIEGEEAVQPRAYWLNENAQPVKHPFRPTFVSPPAAQKMTPIPLVESPALVVTTTPGLCAVVATNGQDFTLYSGERKISDYELPVYRDASGRTKQILLTPLAVVADLTIVGGVLAVWLLPAWWGSLNNL
jgi:hypothetical protein